MHSSAELVILNFGKYNGYSLAYIYRTNKSYLEWMATNDGLSEAWRLAAKETLLGQDISHLSLPRKKDSGYKPTTITPSKIVKIYFVSKNTAAVEMPFNREKMNLFKYEVDGRVWNAEERRWEFPIPHLPKVFEVFADHDIRCDQNVLDVRDALLKHREQLNIIREKEDTDFEVADLLLPLYPYQKVGVEFVHKAAGRAMIADEPGLGKTVQAIAYARLHKLKTLIVCPLSVVITWKKEIAKFTGLTPCIWTTDGKEGHCEDVVVGKIKNWKTINTEFPANKQKK